MKTSKFFLSTLVAAAAMTSTVLAENLTVSGDLEIPKSESNTYDVISVVSASKITISEGTVVTTTRYTGADGNGAKTTLDVNGTFTVLGTATDGSSGSAGSFNMSHWGAGGSVNVYGTLNLNSGLSVKNGSGSLTVKEGGVVNFVNGITFSGETGGITMTMDSGSRVNVGSGGISEVTNASVISWWYSTPVNMVLNGGTLGVLGKENEVTSWSSSRALSLSGDVTFDTEKWVMAADGNSSAKAESSDTNAAGAITLSGAITGTGKLIKSGVGTLTLSGSYSAGTIEVNAGTLAISGTVSLSSAIQNSGTVIVNAGAFFDLTNLTADEDGVYTLASGTVSAEGVTYKNFSLGGGRSEINTANGGLTFRAGAVYDDLVWCGNGEGKDGEWNASSENWNSTKAGGTIAFAGKDSVVFSTADAVVTVVGTVDPTAMTIDATTTLKGTGTVEVANDKLTLGTDAALSIAEGVTLALGTQANGKLNKNITGSGTISWGNTEGSHDTTISLSNFSGDLQLSGNISTEKFDIGSTKKLIADGLWFWGNAGVKEITADIEVTDSYGIGYASKANFYVNGNGIKVTGNFLAEERIVTFVEGDNTLKGRVAIGALNVAGGNTTISDVGGAIDKLSVENGNTSFKLESGAVLSVKTFYGSAGGDGKTLSSAINGVLNVSGSETNSGSSASFMMANGGGTHTITVKDGGVLNLVNAGLSNRDGTGVLSIEAAGEANFGKGLHILTNNAGWGGASLSLNGGTLNISADDSGVGISKGAGQQDWSNVSVNLNSGTVGSLSDSWSSSLDFALGGDVTFDTRKKAINDKGNATVVSEAYSEITLSGVLSDATDKVASVTLVGAGSLILAGENTYTGGTTISAGTLVAASATALGTGDVSVGEGATLMLKTGVTVSDGAVSLAEGAKFALDISGFILSASDEDSLALDILSATALSFNELGAGTLTSAQIESYFDADNSVLGTYEEYLRTWSYADNKLTLTLAIPEPSAFGLLAGLGALALVGMRRRRRK